VAGELGQELLRLVQVRGAAGVVDHHLAVAPAGRRVARQAPRGSAQPWVRRPGLLTRPAGDGGFAMPPASAPGRRAARPCPMNHSSYTGAGQHRQPGAKTVPSEEFYLMAASPEPRRERRSRETPLR
jgi:hypothetical protein